MPSGTSYATSESSESTDQPPEEAEFLGSAPAPETTAQGISSQAFSQGYFQKFFITEKELGRGGKGVVFLVRHVLDEVFLGRFACKRVPVGNDHEWLKKVLVEVQLLTNLTHPNLVQYKHVWLEDYQISSFGPSVPCAFILQQYCNGGDLHDYILDSAKVKVTTEQMKDRLRRRSKGQIDTPDDPLGPRRMHFDEIFSFFKDITAGLHHLHVNNYIHRDLKPSNCLLSRDPSGKPRVLVSDFGEVQVVSARRNSTGSTGTISYCAPEVLFRDATTGGLGNFTTKSDIFSLGMIVYFMCFSRLPYKSANQLDEENEDVDQLRAEIAHWVGFDDQQKRRTDLPDRLYKFLRRLLSVDPNERPSTDGILHLIGVGGDPEELGNLQARPHPFHDIGTRVQNIETPSPTPQRMPSDRRVPLAAELNSPEAGATRGLRHLYRGPSSLRHVSPPKQAERQLRSSLHGRAAYVEGEDSDSDSDHDSDSNSYSYNDSLGGGVGDTDMFADDRLERSLTLRKRGPSSTPPPQSPQRLLLPAPPDQSSFLSRVIGDRHHRIMLRLVLFVLKAGTLLQSCAPYTPRSTVMYPLLTLAALDFVYAEGDDRDAARSVLLSIALLGVHVAIVALVGRLNGLCLVNSGADGIHWD